ncbi:hypothetical protein GCM10007094_22930 [Pseudovibrio japonicus]|uniref:Uncharacterized protein n=1 Tax=Pseudovibrio japonicus TaxID=366534 RepID=A0ABQ3EFY5_9HYPH|nr:hypothetical protein GCM10007094_22930 [Pseudovibrio japonicus]
MHNRFIKNCPIHGAYRNIHGDLMSDILSLWDKTGGQVVDEFLPYIEYLVQFKGDYVRGDLPVAIYSGSKTLAAKILGDKWSGCSQDLNSDLDLAFRSYVAEGYRAAVISNEPILDIISYDFRVSESEVIWVAYSRLIFPLYLKTGKALLGSLALPTQPIVRVDRQDLQHPLGRSQRTKGRGEILLHDAPIGSP